MFADSGRMKSAGNRGVVQSRLQVLHIHVFFIVPLGTSHAAKPCADQHQDRVPVRKCSHHAGPAADLTIQPSNYVVGANARSMFTGKVAVVQHLINAVLHFLGGSFQFHRFQLSRNGFGLLTGGFLVQFTDGGWRDFAAPQGSGVVLCPAHGDACQVHLNERFLHAALPTAIPLDDSRLKGHALESGHMERNVAGGCGEVSVIVTAAAALTGRALLRS